MKLEVNNIQFRYTGNVSEYSGRILYDDFSLTIESGERVGIIAPSGFGKTTLCKLIAGYEKPLAGEILLDGKPVSSYKGYCPVQMIWQHPETVLNPRLRMKHVLEEVGDIPEHVIKGLGIRDEWLNRFPQELSGGELQRFCIARALSPRTRFILADEISTMLDLITQKQIWDFLIEEIRSREAGLIAVSHSPALLERICTRIIDLTKET
ncbi:MAG: ATP-binding cassette domain-containing protein [Clostridiales bacterium]|nr:ATP-binding cassette domain-containing protein [Clostridiales bacterium]